MFLFEYSMRFFEIIFYFINLHDKGTLWSLYVFWIFEFNFPCDDRVSPRLAHMAWIPARLSGSNGWNTVCQCHISLLRFDETFHFEWSLRAVAQLDYHSIEWITIRIWRWHTLHIHYRRLSSRCVQFQWNQCQCGSLVMRRGRDWCEFPIRIKKKIETFLNLNAWFF